MNNRYVLILGSSGLIGNELVKYLLKINYNVLGVDIVPNGKLKNNKNFLFIKKHIKSEKSIDELFSSIVNKKIKIYYFINLLYPKSKQWGKKFGNLKLKYINMDLNLQLGIQIYFLQQLFKYFINLKIKGKVVLISSIQGFAAPKFNHYENLNMTSPIEYTAIKSATISITKYLAKFYKGYNFNINCISPGGIFDNQNKIFIKRYKKDTLNKGLLNAEDLFGAINFLISDDSKYINGQNLIIDDGWSL